MSELTIALLFLLLGLAVGALCAWLIAKFKFSAISMSDKELEERFVPKALYESLYLQLDLLKDEIRDKEENRLVLEKTLSAKERDILYLEDKFAAWQSDFESLKRQTRTEFENVSNRLFEEKAKKFADQSQQQLNDLLHPLKERIKEFGQNIESKFIEDAKDKVSLKKEIELLRTLNQQLSTDAQNLATALKGDSKTQGDWGEYQLELLLEKAGLQKGIHYYTQPTFKDENGADKRPDFIIQLPESKHLIVDSKVSLLAYEKFYTAETKEKKSKHLKSHIESIRNHVKDLNGKNYQQLYQINSPDYLLLFVPIEAAFTAALQNDTRLFLDALEKNIVIVTTSTLLATMRTVSYIWRQEKQKNNVLEIAKQSGLLYDKFVGFVEDLKEVGQRIDSAQSAWNGAMNKLTDSKKYGSTLIGRAQKIKELGAKAAKSLPKELVSLTDDLEEENSEKLNN